MTRYWICVGLVLFFFLVAFLAVESLHPFILTDPGAWMGARSVGAALAGIGLLVVDLLLPVPSSLVMIANGALFGITLGTVLSLLGSLGAAIAGFWIGRRGGPLLARFVSVKERARADRLLQAWGLLAIIVTRPIPILAETTMLMAGASTVGWGQMLLATLIGSLPSVLLYAITGATAATLNNSILSFGLVLLLAGGFWIVGRRVGQVERRPVS